MMFPILQSSYNSIALSRTGSGKTMSFLLPLLNSKKNFIVISPTRELAEQIFSQLQLLKQGGVLFIGGLPKQSQIRRYNYFLEKSNSNKFKLNCRIIATPGRLLDMLNTIDLQQTKFDNLILDEGDRLLDMGFQQDIIKIIEKVQPTNVNLFSATWDDNLQINKLIQNPLRIQIGNLSNKKIKQQITYVFDKNEQLLDIIQQKSDLKILIFCNRIETCDNLNNYLSNKTDKNIGLLHSQITYYQRQDIMKNFRSNKINILIASDICNRGIDIPDVDLIVNYDMPYDFNTYVHRIGRTGRHEMEGWSITFAENGKSLSQIIQYIQQNKGEVDHSINKIYRYKLQNTTKIQF